MRPAGSDICCRCWCLGTVQELPRALRVARTGVCSSGALSMAGAPAAGRKFVADVTAQHGEIDHAVSCFGAWWQGGELLPVCLSSHTLCST